MAALLLLDLDNTLIDREGAFLAWAQARAREWAPSDPDAVAYFVEQDADGVRARDAFFAGLAARFSVQRSIDSLIADYRRELRAALAPVRTDVIQRLCALRADGWKIAVVTNGDADVQADKVDRLGIAPLLDACCISGAIGVRKPDARIFQIAAARCGTPLSNAWMIGDGEADIVGAHRADIHSIWLHRGRTWRRSDVRPDHIADNLVEGLSLLTSRP
jgi:HAD superfamily hydrolase (TIGR01509 family)